MKKWFKQHRLRFGLVFKYTKDHRVIVKPNLMFNYEASSTYEYNMTVVDYTGKHVTVHISVIVPIVCVNPEGRLFDPQTGRAHETVLKLA